MPLKKTLILSTVLLFLASSAAFAAEKKSLSYWIKNTGSKIQSVSKKPKKDTATAGVKGDPEKAADELYWKEGKQVVKDEEIKSLENAVDLVNKGQNDEAVKALEAFLKDYPKSALKADAEEGLKILKAQRP
ncbi:MAG: tetratricopeptide repeat protein [Deltaproteobacteria bacterium]|nr:tetratricopeptide repeat protein [Deltaproteobacteria bacterium]